MTLRLTRDQADELELIASVDGKPMSEEIREALVRHVATRREDPEFQARLRRSRDRLRQLSGETGAVVDVRGRAAVSEPADENLVCEGCGSIQDPDRDPTGTGQCADCAAAWAPSDPDSRG